MGSGIPWQRKRALLEFDCHFLSCTTIPSHACLRESLQIPQVLPQRWISMSDQQRKICSEIAFKLNLLLMRRPPGASVTTGGDVTLLAPLSYLSLPPLHNTIFTIKTCSYGDIFCIWRNNDAFLVLFLSSFTNDPVLRPCIKKSCSSMNIINLWFYSLFTNMYI